MVVEEHVVPAASRPARRLPPWAAPISAASTNWSGYAVAGASGTFVAATGHTPSDGKRRQWLTATQNSSILRAPLAANESATSPLAGLPIVLRLRAGPHSCGR